MRIEYIHEELCNSKFPEVKALINEYMGVSISVMPAKIYGRFQPSYSRVKVTILDGVVGRTCNGMDFMRNERKVKQVLKQLFFHTNK